MLYRLGYHARRRMRERGITPADIERAMANVISRVGTSEDSVKVRGYGQPGRVLKVWLPNDDPTFVKSVAWEGE